MKMESKTTSKNKVEIKRGGVLFWGGRRGSGDPLGRGTIGGGEKNYLSQHAMGQGPANLRVQRRQGRRGPNGPGALGMGPASAR